MCFLIGVGGGLLVSRHINSVLFIHSILQKLYLHVIGRSHEFSSMIPSGGRGSTSV